MLLRGSYGGDEDGDDDDDDDCDDDDDDDDDDHDHDVGDDAVMSARRRLPLSGERGRGADE